MDARKREALGKVVRMALAPKLAQWPLEVVVRSWKKPKVGGADGIRTHDLLDAIESSEDDSK